MESKFVVRMSASEVELACRGLERMLDPRDAAPLTPAGRRAAEDLLERLSARRVDRHGAGPLLRPRLGFTGPRRVS